MVAMGSMWVVLMAIAGALLFLRSLLKNVNWWLYESKLGVKQYSLPPGDMGWPFIGNMWSFLRAFKSKDPDSFISSFVSRYGRTGVYKVLMFGNPSVIVTTPEACRRVLTDDDKFTPGWPRSTIELIGKRSFIGMAYEEHKRLRRLTSSSINGMEALCLYLTYIEENVKSSLEKWANMGQIEFLTEIRKLTFKIIMHIFLSSESEPVMEALEKEYTTLNHGVRAMQINIPGFAYRKALKARKKLVAIFQSIVDERRNMRKGYVPKKAKDMMDALIDVEDDNGRKLSDEDIIDIMLMYLNAGHESSGHITMWATYFLQKHPEYLQKAKAEQEEIVKRRPSTQKGLTLKEIREMDFLYKVIDETMRVITFSLMVFREAKSDVNINGYTIPKGWKVLVWFRSVHLDPEIYPNPKEFNPNRWNKEHKAGEFLPFGAGSRLCPGNDLAKMEIAVFLHHFLLNYQFGKTGIYKALMFGNPSVIVTTPEACKRVLTDDDKFTLGWPSSTVDLIGKKSFIAMSYEEHRRLRRLTSASINGYEALSVYLRHIEEIVIDSLEKWAKMGDIEFLTQMRKLTFKIIVHIFLGAESDAVMAALEKEYTALNLGVRAMRINLPGFAFHKAFQARKNLVAIFQSIVDKRRNERKENYTPSKKAKDMMDALIDVEDENGRKLGDDDIIDIMLMYLNAGHESSGHITTWATYYLQKHPEYLRKAKEEQEEILRKRPPTQKGLILEEVRQMDFISKVIDETLRVVTFSSMVFREAKSDVNLNGYLIPKGWKILVWFRTVHLDPEVYPNPREFNPYRWNEVHKAGEFLPFGAGTRLCPGNDLAKLEISVFLHHFLLNYELEHINPKSPVRFLPHTRPVDNFLARIKKRSSA